MPEVSVRKCAVDEASREKEKGVELRAGCSAGLWSGVLEEKGGGLSGWKAAHSNGQGKKRPRKTDKS